MTDAPDLPVVDPSDVTDDAAKSSDLPTVAGVVLAAGTSSRFGDSNKLLSTIDGEPLVRHALRSLLDAALSPVFVVVGHESEAVREAVDGSGATVIEAPNYERGQSASVRAGTAAVAETNAAAAIFLPGDMPFVDPATVRALVDAYDAGVGDTLAPAIDGRRGNPVLFDRRHFAELRRIDGDVGGRSVLLGSDNAALVSVGDEGVRIDIDTRAQLARQRPDGNG
ncbi:nucleotidyltransferase family protein [Halopenitus persicus]|uniref:Molybdenum cofactor cytidylyltransferase n=1 Tax=Halopenitus persicus TaxID=1048396 RepID=A0A1H3NZG3_9EURY|nr:nucleotidyltransferase family protein [Halopenitus persicus]SDY94267.1 molybdenum cofactor cytidylyltransferase [Halopenitus persicus]